MLGKINRKGHHLDGKIVTLGGRSVVHPRATINLVVQDVRDDANQWHRVQADWVEEIR